MKKTLAVAACALILAITALSACNNDLPEGQIKGEYIEITGSELSEKLNGLDTDKLFGDTSAEDWSFGVDFSAEIEIEADIKTAVEGESVQLVSGDIEVESTLKAMLSATKEQTALNGYSIKARNNNKISGKLDKSELLEMDRDLSFDYSINAYADDGYLYFQIPDLSELPLPFEVAEGKFKTPIEYIVSAMTDMLPFAAVRAADGENTAEEVLEKYALKAYADESDGLKIKVSADENSLYAILEDIGIPSETVKGIASFNTFVINLYFAAGPDGKFDRAGMTADIDGTMNVEADEFEEGNIELKGPIKLKADITLKSFSGEIVLPDSEELEKYIDITAEDEN